MIPLIFTFSDMCIVTLHLHVSYAIVFGLLIVRYGLLYNWLKIVTLAMTSEFLVEFLYFWHFFSKQDSVLITVSLQYPYCLPCICEFGVKTKKIFHVHSSLKILMPSLIDNVIIFYLEE